MKMIAGVVLLVLTLLSGPQVFAQEEASNVSSSITEVTVFSDRAQVTREAVVSVRKAAATYSFRRLPGWVDDGSVRVALLPADAGRIVDVQVGRDYLARPDDEEYRKAQDSVQQITDEIAALDDELAVLNAQALQIEGIKVFAMDKISKDAPLREIKVETYGQVIQFVTASLRETAKARRDLAIKRRQLEPELYARQRKLNEMQALTQLEETTILVTIEGDSGHNARLVLTYMLPGATWEPAHELRAQGKTPDKAEVTSYAVVTQTTGEDWAGATLKFSTQSSTESNRIPELTALTLGDSGQAARIIQGRADSFDRARAAFEGQNRLWKQMNAPVAQAEVQMQIYDNNFDQLVQVQGKAAQVFQQLRTRGTTALFAGDSKPTVRGDGHPVRVRIGRTTLAGQQAITAVPEQSLNAIRTLQMSNAGTQPLLPGTVALYQDGAFLGMTDLPFVAEGETFAVFLGVADQVKLSRVLDRKHSTIDRKKRTTMKVAFVVTVENLAADPVTLDLADRVPVSENKEIEVDDISVSGDKDPDSKGLLRWNLTLQPKEKKSFRIAYRVEYPPELVQQIHRSKMEMRKAMPSAPAAEEYDFSEQILNLEKSF
jgi:uncharacterized protein (TIGR02231 family)